MPDDRATAAVKRWQQLDGDRGTWKSHWQQCANYMLPERADYITEQTPGQKRMTWVYDETPIWGLDQFAAGLSGFATSDVTQWFWVRDHDDAVNADYACRAWQDAASRRMYEVYSSPAYNFAGASHEYYQDTGCIGTAVMAQLESQKSSNILFSTRSVAECVIAENDEEEVDTVIRRFRLSARQAVRMWGDTAGEQVLAAFADTPDRMFWFLHQVKPRTDRDPSRADMKHKAFESLYVSEVDQTVIAESGFDEFPYHVLRFSKSSGEIYGRSPGMRVLPAVKMLNEMAKTLLKAAQKIVDPTLLVPDEGFMLPLKTTPGSKLFFRSGMSPNNQIRPLETHGDVPIGRELLNDYRQMILRGFHVDWFILPTDMQDPASDGKGVTATFTNQKRTENLRQAASLNGRLKREFLGPLITRTFNILWRQSKALKFGAGSPFPPPPARMNGRPLRVEYVSPLAVAQNSSELDAVSQLVRTALGLMQVDPTAGQVIDAEAILRGASADLNAPVYALRSPQMLAEIRQQAEAQQQKAEQMQAAGQAAKAAKDGTGALQNLASVQAQGAAQGAVGAGYGAQPVGQAA